MTQHWRVAEIFGPTIQGEGRQAGLPAYFIRFGGCDLRCSWCDTPHAVLPELISLLPKKDVDEICDELQALPYGPAWVVITGGNPAILKLGGVIDELHARDFSVMVETQGTVFNEWLWKVDELCVSPKPPSSGNTVRHTDLQVFLSKFSEMQHRQMYLKVVVFDDDDYKYARDIHKLFPQYDFFISAGNADLTLPTVSNPFPNTIENKGVSVLNTRQVVAAKFKWLAEKVSQDMVMDDVRVLPQLHVIAWGNERGR